MSFLLPEFLKTQNQKREKYVNHEETKIRPTATEQIVDIPVNKIISHGNMRTNFEKSDLADLMTSMKQHGLLQAVRVMPSEIPNSYDLIYGNRRLASAKKLGWKVIPAIVQTRENDIDTLVTHLTENVQQAAVPLSDEGKGYEALLAQGLSVKEMAARVGVDVSRIKRAVALYRNVPDKYRDKINSLSGRSGAARAGKISGATAYQLSKAAKAGKLTPAQNETLYNMALAEELHSPQASLLAQLLAANVEFDRAVELSVSATVHNVLFALSPGKAKELCEKFGTVSKALQAVVNEHAPDFGYFNLNKSGNTSVKKDKKGD